MAFANRVEVPSREGCYFYHAINLPNGEALSGDWDMRGAFPAYIGKTQLAGARVLDVGTASGFIAFEAEKAGAREVVAFEAATGRQRELVPTKHVRDNREALAIALDQQMDSMKRSFWYCHNALNSKVRAYYGDIYTIGDDIGRFDVALIGQILVHLKHPCSALEQIARVTEKTIVITERVVASDDPLLKFIWRPEDPNNHFAWWHASVGFYAQFLKVLGFSLKRRSTAEFKLNVPGAPGKVPLTTMVFEREG